MVKYAMVVNVNRCNGCFTCQIACKDEFVDNEWHPYSASQPETGHFWMKVNELERGVFPKVKLAYIAEPCMQCDKPPCLNAAKDGAIYKREDGIVIIDPQKSAGQEQILSSCPYKRIYWNEKKGIPQKCTFCAHLIDAGWKQPRCVEVCPTGALSFGDLDDASSEVSNLINEAEIPHGEYNTLPSVYYIGLPKKFISGSVVCKSSDECLENVNVNLTDLETQKSLAMKTNRFGDFEFEDLEEKKNYLLNIEKKGYLKVEIGPIMLEKNEYLGEIFLEKE